MSAAQPLILGEVLLDHFADGSQQLGGAPFNVAWNLRGLGFHPTLVSAVGNDQAGQQVLDRMHAWGLATQAVQQVCSLQTGRVEVTLANGQPSFDILDRRAWDAIRSPLPEEIPAAVSLVYQGTLALRHEVSRDTLLRLASDAQAPRFVDVNIRQPWFANERLTELLPGANWVKLNDAELADLTHQPCETESQIQQAAQQLRQQYGGDCFLITCGARGAYAVEANGSTTFAPAIRPEKMVDTVGAGDAFAASIIAGILQGQPMSDCLPAAVRFAALACTLRGATTDQLSHYQQAPSPDA